MNQGALLFQPSEAGGDHSGVTGPPTRLHRSTANPNFILFSSRAYFSFFTRLLLISPDTEGGGGSLFIYREARLFVRHTDEMIDETLSDQETLMSECFLCNCDRIAQMFSELAAPAEQQADINLMT